ncbi:response regulator transcription factor [Amphritea sp. HPY]|uniref:response regulator transcription factor n=1 Tax=Amphritea sp. HPY TaxID=3421652 RepID=UPI003D7F0530
MHIFVSKKPLSPVRWHEAFPDAVTVRNPAEVAAVLKGSGVIWLDFTAIGATERAAWLVTAKQLRTPFIVLSNVPNDDEAMRVFGAGGSGYCHVLAAPQQLQEIALVVEHGGYWVGAKFIEKVLSISSKHMSDQTVCNKARFYNSLTEREQMVAQLVGKGESNNEIAGSLGITERTVKAHMSSIFSKSGARDRIQLVLMLNEKEAVPA